MIYLSPKCADREAKGCATVKAEVSLAEFAAIGGLTEAEFCKKMFEKIESGQLFDLLTLKSQYKLGEWISEYFLENNKQFLIAFRLSLNRLKDVTLYCICKVDFNNDSGLEVINTITGTIDATPTEAQNLPRMIFDFHDMEPSI